MNRYLRLFSLALPVAIIDQATKALVLAKIPLHDSIPVLDGFFNLVHARNRGAAFGFLNRPDTDWQFWLFGGATLLAAVIILYLTKTIRQDAKGAGLSIISLGLVLGGAVGNFIDRVRHKSVVDFLDFQVGDWHWPAFNVADIAITCGVFLLLAITLLRKDPGSDKSKTGSAAN